MIRTWRSTTLWTTWINHLVLAATLAGYAPASHAGAGGFFGDILGSITGNNPFEDRRPPRGMPGGYAGTPSRQGISGERGEWRLLKTEWTEEDENGYSEFVRALGRSGCRTVDQCIRSEANPFRDSDPHPEDYTFWSDCADWPYFLRSYYAFKNGLPMAIAYNMSALPLTAEQQQAIAEGKEKAQTDLRYSWNGIRPESRMVLPDLKSGVSNYFEMHSVIQNRVSTANFRMDPRENYSDLYTPAIMPYSIRPGTAVYDPSGHVGVVYDVTADGQVMVFDALVNTKSISPRRAYSSDFYARSKIEHGGWFQNFRPVSIEGAEWDSWSGSFVGGRLRLASNDEIMDYSLEMYGNQDLADGRKAYRVEGKVVNTFQEFLRRRLFQGEYKLDVIGEYKLRLKAVCDDFGSRVGLVQDATKLGIASQPHGEILPNTIYGGDGVWDKYSTPGGDVRRRNSVNNIISAAKEMALLVKTKPQEYVYRGANLKQDLINTTSETLKNCSITYTNTIGKPVRLNLGQLIARTPRMSFSPWHCVELRWGASSPEELASCPDIRDNAKVRWYNATQTMRNQMARNTDIFTGYTLEQLEGKTQEVGPALPPNLNLVERMQTELQ